MPCSLTGGIGRAESFGLKFRTAPLIAVIRGRCALRRRGAAGTNCPSQAPSPASCPCGLILQSEKLTSAPLHQHNLFGQPKSLQFARSDLSEQTQVAEASWGRLVSPRVPRHRWGKVALKERGKPGVRVPVG